TGLKLFLAQTVARRHRLEPAAPSKEREQQREREDLGADAKRDKRAPAADMANLEAEILAEKAGQPTERQEDRGDDRQLLHDRIQSVGDRRQVDVHRTGEEVAVAIDQVADPDQMVVDIA